MADVTGRNRVQAGVPTGGEFAAEAKGENSDLTAPQAPRSWSEIAEEKSAGDPSRYPEFLPKVGERVFISIEDADEPNNQVATLTRIDPDYGDVPSYVVTFADGSHTAVMPWEMFPLTPEQEQRDHRRAAMGIARDRSLNPGERVAKLMDLDGFTASWVDPTERIDPATGLAYYSSYMTLTNPRSGESITFPYGSQTADDPNPQLAMFMLLYGERQQQAEQTYALSDWAKVHGYATDDEYEMSRAQSTWETLKKLSGFLGEDAYAFRMASRR